MPTSDKSPQESPFEIITPGKSKKSGKTGLIVGIAIVVFLILSVGAGVYLIQQQQNVSEKAAVSTCPEVEACPVSSRKNSLMSCHPADTDGTAVESLCSSPGRVETCGTATTWYCCPAAGGSWTRTMTAECQANVAKKTATTAPTTTPTMTPTLTSTPTSTALGTANTPTATPTGGPGSCNKTCGSNSNCESGLYCYSGYCRNALCASDSTCACSSTTITPTPTIKTSTSSAQTTPLPIPVTGIDWPTVAGVGLGIGAILVSILLAL